MRGLTMAKAKRASEDKSCAPDDGGGEIGDGSP